MAVDKLVDSTKLDACCTAEANAIRAKTGGSAQIVYDLANSKGFSDAIAAIPSGGGGLSPDEFYGLGNDSYELEFNSLTELRLRTPFYYNTKVTKLTSDTLTWIENNAFRGCSNLEEIDLPNCTKIGQNNVNSSDSYAFGNCPKLVKFNLPKVTNINGQYNFANCGTSSNKALIVLPKVVELGYRTFRDGYFSAVDIGPDIGVNGIRGDTFLNGRYDVVILRKSSVVTAENTNAIKQLTTANGTTIYVPQALLSTYPTSTNWSSDTRTYAAIEGSYYETHYADGTLIS